MQELGLTQNATRSHGHRWRYMASLADAAPPSAPTAW